MSTVVNLSTKYSLISNWMNELRNSELQTDRMRFRRNLERIGEVAAYEISKILEWTEEEIQTPLGTHTGKVLKKQPVLATILRAGLPLHQGMLNYFDKADNCFISAYRKHQRDGSFDIKLEYISCPQIDGKTVIICDPMLATGASALKAIRAIKETGTPSQIHIVTVIACSVGIEYVRLETGDAITIWCGDIDEELTAKGLIVPGLGDAGDLAFGLKTRF